MSKSETCSENHTSGSSAKVLDLLWQNHFNSSAKKQNWNTVRGSVRVLESPAQAAWVPCNFEIKGHWRRGWVPSLNFRARIWRGPARFNPPIVCEEMQSNQRDIWTTATWAVINVFVCVCTIWIDVKLVCRGPLGNIAVSGQRRRCNVPV